MTFLNPIFLWALLGLSIPVAIHFWSKKKVKTIKIGSTQLLKELNPKQTRSIQLNEWVLLLLRLAILTLIVMILAGPSIDFLKKEKSLMYLVEPSLLGQEKVKAILDSIENSEVRLLKTGFPLLEENDFTTFKHTNANYWQLAQQMESLQADSIIVLAKGLRTGFRGMRPVVKTPIHWLLFDADESSLIPVEAVQSEDQLHLTSISSDRHSLDYTHNTYALDDQSLVVNETRDSVLIYDGTDPITLPLLQEKEFKVLIVADDNFLAESIYLKAGFDAISKYLNQNISVRSVKDIQEIDLSNFDVLAWLKQEFPISFEGKTLIWQPDALSMNLIEPGISKDQYLLRHHLDGENSVGRNLPQQLISLFELHPRLPEAIELLDQRTMDLQEMQVNTDYSQRSQKLTRTRDISSWLWIGLLFLLPAERILSKIRKQ